MARSSYIYLITTNGNPHAAFTVKHEMVSYINNFMSVGGEIKIYRIKDNPRYKYSAPTEITQEVLA